MKIASWILTVLSYVLAAVMIVVGVFSKDLFFYIFGAILFIAFGLVGHILISKVKSKRGDFGKDGLAVYILSFPQFILPFVIIFVVLMILKIADFFIYLFTDKHYVANAVNTALNALLGRPQASDYADYDESDDGDANEVVYTVNGVDYELVRGGYVCFPVDGKPIGGQYYPTDGKNYPLFRDIRGIAPNCTSFDGGKTLVVIPTSEWGSQFIRVYIP